MGRKIRTESGDIVARSILQQALREAHAEVDRKERERRQRKRPPKGTSDVEGVAAAANEPTVVATSDDGPADKSETAEPGTSGTTPTLNDYRRYQAFIESDPTVDFPLSKKRLFQRETLRNEPSVFSRNILDREYLLAVGRTVDPSARMPDTDELCRSFEAQTSAKLNRRWHRTYTSKKHDLGDLDENYKLLVRIHCGEDTSEAFADFMSSYAPKIVRLDLAGVLLSPSDHPEPFISKRTITEQAERSLYFRRAYLAHMAIVVVASNGKIARSIESTITRAVILVYPPDASFTFLVRRSNQCIVEVYEGNADHSSRATLHNVLNHATEYPDTDGSPSYFELLMKRPARPVFVYKFVVAR